MMNISLCDNVVSASGLPVGPDLYSDVWHAFNSVNSVCKSKKCSKLQLSIATFILTSLVLSLLQEANDHDLSVSKYLYNLEAIILLPTPASSLSSYQSKIRSPSESLSVHLCVETNMDLPVAMMTFPTLWMNTDTVISVNNNTIDVVRCYQAAEACLRKYLWHFYCHSILILKPRLDRLTPGRSIVQEHRTRKYNSTWHFRLSIYSTINHLQQKWLCLIKDLVLTL